MIRAKKVEIISRADLTCVAYGWPACVAFSITGIPKVARAINWSELQLGCVYSGTEFMIMARFSKACFTLVRG